MTQVAIFGAGAAGCTLLETIHNDPAISVLGVVDPDATAPGVCLAKTLGIPVATDDAAFLKKSRKRLDVIIDMTGSAKLSDLLQDCRNDGVAVLSGRSAELVRALIGGRRNNRRESQGESDKLLKAYQSVYKLSVELSSSNYIPTLYKTVIDYAADLTDMPAASLAILEEQNGEMVMVASKGFSKGFAQTYRWKVRQGGLTSHILNQDGPFVIDDFKKYPHFDNPLFLAEKIRAMAAIPLSADGKLVGILYVNDFEARVFSKLSTSILSLIATITAALIQKAKVMEMTQLIAITDELTGLYNHRHFVQRLSSEIARASRYRHTLTLAMLDIDHFKSYNDRYGHLEGNQVLQLFGKIIKAHLREADIPARYGGEEFAIIMPETAKQEGKTLAERLRKTIEETDFNLHDALSVRKASVSIGLASFPEDASVAHDLIGAADRALYQAKEAGRNRVFLASESSTPPKNRYLC
jgi:diguanylate cyclase (GGDEF)-like protein